MKAYEQSQSTGPILLNDLLMAEESLQRQMRLWQVKENADLLRTWNPTPKCLLGSLLVLRRGKTKAMHDDDDDDDGCCCAAVPPEKENKKAPNDSFINFSESIVEAQAYFLSIQVE
jgi:hypothetical protein